MSNLFDSANYPTEVPTELQLGDYWAWKKDNLSTDYPTASYALSYEFNLVDGSTASNFTLNATESNDEYLITTTSSVRSHAKIVLDAIEAVIENRANIDQSSMSIAGRSLSRMSIDDLLTFRARYKAEYLKEVKQARIKNGRGSGNTIKVNFGKNA